MPDDRQSLRDWHRLFGLLLTDFFTDSPFTVEIERDLSEQQQFLDVLILRRGPGRMVIRLPDGLEDLAAHNLVTFKSHHETLDAWAMKELIGHYVAYRKLVSPKPTILLPEDQFRLFAVSARFPQKLSSQVEWRKKQTGVYDCQWGTDVVRIVVAGELPRETRNAPLHLFSASQELVGFAKSAYRQHSEDASGLLGQVFEKFHGEGLLMPYTMEDFRRDYAKKYFPRLTSKERQEALEHLTAEQRREMLQTLPPEERMEGLPPEERIAGMPPEQRLAGMPPEQRLAGMPPAERLAGMPPEERLAGIPPEEIRKYLDEITAFRPASKRKQKKRK